MNINIIKKTKKNIFFTNGKKFKWQIEEIRDTPQYNNTIFQVESKK